MPSDTATPLASPDYPAMSPYLISSNGEALIAFVQAAFDGLLLRRFDHPGGSLKHAEMKIADSVLMIGGAATEFRSAAAHIHLYVPDAVGTFERAVAAGAEVVLHPQRKQAGDDLRGGVRDASGTTWWIASR